MKSVSASQDLVSDEKLASMGMVNDIKSLGNLLRTLLPFLRHRQIHVSLH